MPTLSDHNPILVALDVSSQVQAQELAQQLKPFVGGFKIGLELFCSAGPQVVEEIGPRNVFLDLKFHDIPNTVAAVSRSVARLRVLMFNVHCLGGKEMMRAAVEAAREEQSDATVIGVTILTSHNAAQLQELGLEEEPAAAVRRLAAMAREAGLQGVVCSPQEIKAVRAECGEGFLLVTPGVRPTETATNDQKRTATPGQALADGADWLVIGRPITSTTNPAQSASAILQQIRDLA